MPSGWKGNARFLPFGIEKWQNHLLGRAESLLGAWCPKGVLGAQEKPAWSCWACLFCSLGLRTAGTPGSHHLAPPPSPGHLPSRKGDHCPRHRLMYCCEQPSDQRPPCITVAAAGWPLRPAVFFPGWGTFWWVCALALRSFTPSCGPGQPHSPRRWTATARCPP